MPFRFAQKHGCFPGPICARGAQTLRCLGKSCTPRVVILQFCPGLWCSRLLKRTLVTSFSTAFNGKTIANHSMHPINPQKNWCPDHSKHWSLRRTKEKTLKISICDTCGVANLVPSRRPRTPVHAPKAFSDLELFQLRVAVAPDLHSRHTFSSKFQLASRFHHFIISSYKRRTKMQTESDAKIMSTY